MKKFLTLLKVSIQSMLLSSTNSRGRSRKKAATGLGAIVVIAGLGLYLSGFYSYMLMQALAPSHMEILVFIFMGITPELEHRKSGYVERKRRPCQGNVARIA